MTKNYNGYEIRTYETMGIGCGEYFELWKDGRMLGFAKNLDDAILLADSLDAEK